MWAIQPPIREVTPGERPEVDESERGREEGGEDCRGRAVGIGMGGEEVDDEDSASGGTGGCLSLNNRPLLRRGAPPSMSDEEGVLTLFERSRCRNLGILVEVEGEVGGEEGMSDYGVLGTGQKQEKEANYGRTFAGSN